MRDSDLSPKIIENLYLKCNNIKNNCDNIYSMKALNIKNNFKKLIKLLVNDNNYSPLLRDFSAQSVFSYTPWSKHSPQCQPAYFDGPNKIPERGTEGGGK